MNIEDLLTRSAHEVAAEVVCPPTADAAALRGRALAGRRRRRAGVVVAAAALALAAAVLVPSLSTRATRSDPADVPLPSVDMSGPAWAGDDGDIHLGAHVVATSPELSKFALTRTGVVWARQGLRDLTWQPVGAEPRRLVDGPVRLFATDPTGDTVVWVTPDDELVVFDLSHQEELYRRVVDNIDLPKAQLAGSSAVLSVDDRAVLFEAGGAVWRISLAQRNIEATTGAMGRPYLDKVPGVSAVALSRVRDSATGDRSLTRIGFVRDSGTVRAQDPRLFGEGQLSPDGRYFITSTGYERGLRPVLLEVSTGRTLPLDLPDQERGALPDPWSWSGDTVMLYLMSDDGRTRQVWTCDAETRACGPLPEAADIPW